MKVILNNIGREKYNGIIDANNDEDILREVSKHLLSRDIDIAWNGNEGIVIAGMGYAVGKVIKGASDETITSD